MDIDNLMDIPWRHTIKTRNKDIESNKENKKYTQ